MAENKDKKVLNVPNKREITPNELGSAEHKEVRLKRNVPNLRFKEFSGEWEEKRLGEIGESFIGLTYKPTDIVAKDGIIVFRSSNIQNGVIDYKDIVRVDRKVKEKLITKKDDLLVCARNGSTRLIGKNALLKEVDSNQTFGAFMMVFRSDKNRFVHQLLNTKRYMSQISENLGARINQITSADLSSFKFFFPQNYEEIQKIASFLDLLDERIATQNKIIEELKKLKSAIIENVLDNYHDNKMQLGDVGIYIRGLTYSSNDVVEQKGTIVMRSNNIINGSLLDYDNNVVRVNKQISKEQQLEHEDIVVCMANGSSDLVGKSSFYDGKCLSPITVGAFCGIYRSKEPITKWLFQTNRYRRYIWNSLQGGNGAIANINGEDILRMSFSIPDKSKIKHCTKLLSSLDSLIGNEVSLYSKFFQQKQYLLRQMFI